MFTGGKKDKKEEVFFSPYVFPVFSMRPCLNSGRAS